MDEKRRVQELADSLGQTLGSPPRVAVILGSGWKERATDLLDDARELAVTSLVHWPQPQVAGHGAELRLGSLDGVRAVFCTGRVHAYEGHPAAVLVRGVRALAGWGVSHLLLLNAAGSLDEARCPGQLMPFTDHLNLGLPNPLRHDQVSGPPPGFLSLVDLYDSRWRAATLQGLGLGLEGGGDVVPGVYAGVAGPTYETPAEVRMLRGLGADAVGMSTIPEAIAGRAAGMKVAAISLLTNLAAGLAESDPNHAEVLATARAHGDRAAVVLAAAVRAAALE